MSNNLNLDQVAANQTQKETTINAATAELDAALTEVLSVDMSGGGDVTLTAAQFRGSFIFTPTGQTGATQHLILPASVKRGVFAVQNLSSTYPILLKKGTAVITIAALATGIFKTDGTTNDCVKLADGMIAGTVPYDIGQFTPGIPTASQLMLRYVFARAVTLPISLTGSQATAGTASTGTATLTLKKNGSSIGSVVFTASATATFTFSSAVSFAAGDNLTITAPGSPDATLADISITLAGLR